MSRQWIEGRGLTSENQISVDFADGFKKKFKKAKLKMIGLAAKTARGVADTGALTKTIMPPIGLSIAAEVTDATSLASVFQKAVGKFEKVDVLINNAGASASHMIDLAEWWINFEVNLKGLLVGAKCFAKQIGDQRGKIVNIVSSGGYNEADIAVGYTLYKLVSVKFVRCLAMSQPNLNVASRELSVKTCYDLLLPETSGRMIRQRSEVRARSSKVIRIFLS